LEICAKGYQSRHSRRLWRKLRDLFLEKLTEVNTTIPFLRLYGEELWKSGRIEEREDELIRKVFKRFLERKERDEIE